MPAAAIVKRIYALCLNGRGPSQIARQLEDEKITQHEIDIFYQLVDGLQAADYPTATVEQIIREELAPYLAGEAAEEETAGKIQSRVQLMLVEQFD